ncbi:MAG: Eco57I restriction-modification methylase domain-containing protein, partial [Aeriscardovia sp.]|nr:Eco57I restriction-modification methylase domain-containing protein [Aeriscardovia sp.]
EARRKAEGLEPEAPCFKGACFTDTFYSKEIAGTLINDPRFENNSATVRAEAKAPINVIVSNPPYSSRNDNEHYPEIDERIRITFAEGAEVNNVNSLYNSYLRAFRWASDRIGKQGIIAFITPNTWLVGKTLSGVRRSFEKEFSDIFVVNLRGNDIRNHMDESGGGECIRHSNSGRHNLPCQKPQKTSQWAYFLHSNG